MSAETQSVPYDGNQGFTTYTDPKIKKTGTSLPPRLRESKLKISSFPQTTDISTKSTDSNVVVIREGEFASPEKHQLGVQRKAEVYGTVIEIEAVSVLCELYMDEKQERTVLVKLPKILFPANIRYGTPITLAYRKDASGFKRPSVTIRRIVLDDHLKEENDEMEALINSL